MISRRSIAALVLLLGALAPPGAARADVFLRWDQCLAGGGVGNRDFAGDTDTGSDVLVVSFTAPEAFDQVLGIEATIVALHMGYIGVADPFGEPPPTFPVIQPWWQMSSSGCRPSGAKVGTNFYLEPFASNPACLIPWTTTPFVLQRAQWPVGADSTRMQWVLTAEVAPDQPMTVEAGPEYYGFTLAIKHVNTTGVTGCAGWCTRTVLVVTSLRLIRPPAVGDVVLSPYSLESQVSWQFGNPACETVPARLPSWGRVKTLYR